MGLPATVAELVREFRANGRIVAVGASLAGLRAAEALREEGFTGSLTIIGDEPYEPYDRPPLSKQVLKGWVAADHTKLPRMREMDADWRLGVAATGRDRAGKHVRLADGEQGGYDRLLIATGTGARHRTSTPGRHCRAAPHRGLACRRPPTRRAPEVDGPCAAPGYGGSGGVHTGPPSRPSPYTPDTPYTPYTPKSAVMPARPEA
ncbi:FAD-dependent oxidoreductase [Streptomyces erythrochromogenes]|uniref:FAD-dependent oxidoreductase n=1 Tax=Streptomyces erythrochromogenes TaxID=285574 RepID=UPI0036C87B41